MRKSQSTYDRLISHHILCNTFLINAQRGEHRPRSRIENFSSIDHDTDDDFFPSIVSPDGGPASLVVEMRNVGHHATHGACKEDFVFL
jgi:hypothetical protein